jgi:hypothetical protein
MKHNLHLHVIFNNHKCYFVDKVSKKALTFGIENHGILRLVNAKEAKEML